MICKRNYQITNGNIYENLNNWQKHQSRLFHTYLCCLENMNKNNITVSPNIPKTIIKNHGNWKSEIHENNISLLGLGTVEVYISFPVFP